MSLDPPRQACEAMLGIVILDVNAANEEGIDHVSVDLSREPPYTTPMNHAREHIPPYLQPPKPKKFEELLEECVMAALTHDHPRKFVSKRFAENARALDIQKQRHGEGMSKQDWIFLGLLIVGPFAVVYWFWVFFHFICWLSPPIEGCL